MNKIDWTYITALFSIASGWSLNELGQWIRTRQGDKKIKKRILYNLLETNFIFNQLNNTELINLMSERVLLRIPKQERTDETKLYLNQVYSKLIENFARNNVAKNLKDIEEKYCSAVEDLATIDPIIAYKLNGKTKIFETFSLLQDYYEEIKKTISK